MYYTYRCAFNINNRKRRWAGETSSFFEDANYANWSNIIQDVIELNRNCSCPFRVLSTDRRRYKAVCTRHVCFSVAQFAFSHTFMRPTKFSFHSSELSESSKACRKYTWIFCELCSHRYVWSPARKLLSCWFKVSWRKNWFPSHKWTVLMHSKSWSLNSTEVILSNTASSHPTWLH